MAKTKTAKPAKRSAKKPAKKPANKPAKKPAKKPAAKPAAASSEVEKKVASLLKDYEDGAIDNAWDVIGDMFELDKKLPKTSPLRKAFDKMYGEIEDICRESAGGGD